MPGTSPGVTRWGQMLENAHHPTLSPPLGAEPPTAEPDSSGTSPGMTKMGRVGGHPPPGPPASGRGEGKERSG